MIIINQVILEHAKDAAILQKEWNKADNYRSHSRLRFKIRCQKFAELRRSTTIRWPLGHDLWLLHPARGRLLHSLIEHFGLTIYNPSLTTNIMQLSKDFHQKFPTQMS
jgi:hypothetical protein